MVEVSDSGGRIQCPRSLQGLVDISGVYVDQAGEGADRVMRFCIDLSFPDIGFWRCLRSRNVALLAGKADAVLAQWERKYSAHQDFENDQLRQAALAQLNKESSESIAELRNLLGSIEDVTADWNLLLAKREFAITAAELYGVPVQPDYIIADASGRPIDIERLGQVNKPNLDDTVSQFSPLAKMFRRGEVKKAVEEELQQYSEKRSAVGVTNAERRATLKQAQAIYDASLARFEAEREESIVTVEQMQADYAEGDAVAVEEHSDAVLMTAYCPDIISRSWTLAYDQATRSLWVEMDLPAAAQLELAESWEWSADAGAAVATCLNETGANELCDTVAYQLVIRTVRDLFATDEAGAIDRIVCNGRMVVENPATGARVAYTVMSVSVSKDEFGDLSVASDEARTLFESLGGLAAGLPHELMPVEPLEI